MPIESGDEDSRGGVFAAMHVNKTRDWFRLEAVIAESQEPSAGMGAVGIRVYIESSARPNSSAPELLRSV